MKYAVLGTGGVGRTLGGKLVELGHEVVMGSRSADHAEGLKSFGWDDEEILDLGGIQTALGPEMYLPLWIGIAGRSGNWTTTIRLVRGA